MGRARARRRLIQAGACCCGIGLHLLAGAPAYAQSIEGGQPSDESVCERAGHLAERTHALPPGLLLAIGRVESGRWDAKRGRVVPWPWAIDAAGDGMLIDSKQAAIARTIALRDGGTRSLDVGCYQINLASHPLAFSDLEQAFDPVANADYAARFLDELHARFGTWDGAVAAYHSTEPDRGIPYRQLVFANWSPEDHHGNDPLTGDVRTGTATRSGPLVVEFASGVSKRIWTPGSADPSPGVVTLATDAAAPLPHVITGTPGPR
jgi:Transglycosylase SLT domain